MAIMRTNRLTSKTTNDPPKKRSFVPVSELEAQDAAYNKYQQEMEAYNKKMDLYKERIKNNPSQARDYRFVFGSESKTTRLSPSEAAEWNKEASKGEEFLYTPGDLHLEEKDINVGKGYKEATNYRSEGAYMATVVKPKAPQTKAKKADWSMVELDPIKPKAASFKSKGAPKKLKQRSIEESEKAEFTSPGVETKKKTKTATKRAMTGGGSKGLVKVGGERGVLKSARVTSSVDLAPKMGGYKRQEKLFKAYAGTSVLGESHIGKSAQELGEYKREFKQMKKDYRREGNAEGVVAAGMEANQARLAQKFVRGSQKHFNDPNYKKTTGSENPIAIDYRDSRDNAANRNTMEQKLKSVSSRSKIGKDTGYMNNPMY